MKSFFIAGTMQGSRRGADQIEQQYRQEITQIILSVCPTATIHCPSAIMVKALAKNEQAIRKAHATLAKQKTLDTRQFDMPLEALTSMFHELVDVAAASDVCIAYLPHHEASMGTAVEMFAAYRQGKTVITVTDMRQNLAILSCSTLVIPSLRELGHALSSFMDTGGNEKCA
jgi:hypothetical protein